MLYCYSYPPHARKAPMLQEGPSWHAKYPQTSQMQNLEEIIITPTTKFCVISQTIGFHTWIYTEHAQCITRLPLEKKGFSFFM